MTNSMNRRISYGTYTTKSGLSRPSAAFFLCLYGGMIVGNKRPFGEYRQLVSFGRVSESRHQLINWWLLTNQKETTMSKQDLIADAIYELENIEYDLRRSAQLLVNLTTFQGELTPDVHYVIDRIWDHAKQVTDNYERLFDAWRASR